MSVLSVRYMSHASHKGLQAHPRAFHSKLWAFMQRGRPVCVLGAWKNALVCSGETCVRFLGPGRTHWGLCACIFGDLEEGTASGLYAMWRPTCVHFRGLEERRLGLNPLAQAQNAA